MTNLQAKYIQEKIDQTISKNQEEITNMLLSGLDSSMTTEEILPRMVIRSISISSQIAVQMMMELLTQAEVLEIDEELLKRSFLKILN